MYKQKFFDILEVDPHVSQEGEALLLNVTGSYFWIPNGLSGTSQLRISY